MSVALIPEPRLREFSDLSVVLPGAKLYTYVSGTPSTPLASYSDTIGTLNANPVVASAGGLFPPIYLTANVAYKLVLKDAADVQIWAQDPVRVVSVVNTPAAHGVLIGTGTDTFAVTGTGLAGQALRSGGAAADPAFGEIPQTSVLTGPQNPFPLTAGCTQLFLNNAALITIQGFPAGYAGQRLQVFSIGAGQVDFSNLDAAAAAGTKLLNYAQSAATSLSPGVGYAEFVYDSSLRWRMVAHEQGAGITTTFAAGNFAGGAGTWAVAGVNVVAFSYILRGRLLTITYRLDATVPGGVTSALTAAKAAYGGYAAAIVTGSSAPMALANDGAVAAAYAWVTAAGLQFEKTSGANWAAGVATYIRGFITFEVG